MAIQTWKLACNNAKFPFLYKRAGRGTLIPGLDVAPRVGSAFYGTPDSADYNTMALVYAENVLPIAEGLASVSTQEVIPVKAPPVTDFDRLLILRDAVENNYMFVPARGKNYFYDEATDQWISYNSFAWAGTRTLVTRAYVNGRTFICYEADRIIEYDPLLPGFQTRVLTYPVGFTIADVRGICGAQNYLLFFTDTRVFWSSTLDVLNFNDPIGKSGGQIPIDLKGQITAIQTISGGFIVYTNRNAVAAFFTNNPDAPFTFREVQNSGGVAGDEQITSDSNQAAHYTYGSAGIQVLTLQGAETILPDCSDFLGQPEYETWDATNKIVQMSMLTGALEVKLQLLGNRYLVFSYGKINGQFTYALFYDLVLKRWGKVKVNHVDVSLFPRSILNSIPLKYFELVGPYAGLALHYVDLVHSYGSVLPNRTGFSFLQNTGAMRILITDARATLGDGVCIFGRVQVTRARTCSMQRATFDGFMAVPTPKLTILGSTPGNGKDRNSIKQAYYKTDESTDEYQVFLDRTVFENFDVALEGRMELTAGVIGTTVHGTR